MEKYICTMNGVDKNGEQYSVLSKIVEIEKNKKGLPMSFIENGKDKGMFITGKLPIGTMKTFEMK